MLGLGLAIQRTRMGSLGQQILGEGYFDHYCSVGVSYCSINIGFGSQQIVFITSCESIAGIFTSTSCAQQLVSKDQGCGGNRRVRDSPFSKKKKTRSADLLVAAGW